MFDIMKIGLDTQKLIVDANRITDAEAKAIKSCGLRLVCRPDNLVSMREAQELRDLKNSTPDEVA